MRNHNRLYTLLNVLPDADPVVIEAAYKALMKRHHPDIRDRAEVGERKAAELNQAYQTLRDPSRRAAYDADERSRQERHRAELARAFEPPVARPAPAQGAHVGPVRAGHRVAGWIGAAGVLMLGGAVYLLAQGVPMPPTRPPSPPSNAAALSSRQAESAFRDQPVNRGQVEKALTEFRRIAGTSGLAGIAAYSEHCFDVQSRTRGIADFDHCVAFDHLASRGDLLETRGSSNLPPPPPRFRPQALVARHIDAAELIARDPSLIEARLFEIRRLADNEASRTVAALPANLPAREARPLPRPRVQQPSERRMRAPPTPARPVARRRAQPEQDFLEREGGIY